MIQDKGFIMSGTAIAMGVGALLFAGVGGYIYTNTNGHGGGYAQSHDYMQSGQKQKMQKGHAKEDMAIVLQDIPKGTLSGAEEDALILMREEEKLARDVYTTLYAQWNTKVFDNISKSEQKHMDVVALLLERYKINDPVTDDTTGVFTSSVVQDLYNDFIARGTQSEIAALRVGAEIEELDIRDLRIAYEQSDNEDIRMVYEKLTRASRNHLRAFAGKIEAKGDVYTAQFLTQSDFDAIAQSEREQGTHAAENASQCKQHTGDKKECNSKGEGGYQQGNGQGAGKHKKQYSQ